ncbi:esterase/lipase family protein [Breznakiella homolactica]|uniref:Triacylglycerol lipase n=1 Tax=Breznakiella homolactica TaxID=2798577 RepID=A0A7T7XPC9_9SPIR|nr:hypothetical protein [Breznakiella homolactica]QQO09987.1 hypothetical protein JFL75_03475 [Breznakiella homolactica]
MEKIDLQYPLVLVHGIVAHDRGGIIDFWGRIPKVLKSYGIDVYLGNTDSWGDYGSNAKLLKQTIDDILAGTNKQKVNIIAHSKGGLDSRYLIWKYNFGEKIASLTTIGTPHHGVDIAELIDKQKIVHSRIAKKALHAFGKIYGDKDPNLYNVNTQLTPKYMKDFNEQVPMDNSVYYQSYYTTMRNSFDDLMFFYLHLFTKIKNGSNDGVVTKKSADWGENVFEIKGGISHAEILDIKKKKISGIEIPEIYVDIVQCLSKKGF